MARLRFCDSCGARLPKGASPRRRYCDDVCRAQANRDRKAADRIWGLVVEGAAPHSGWHVSDRSAVMWARAIFDLYWDRATPWPALARAAGSAVTSARQREILHELEAGYSQQQAARRPGLAERTVTKELAELRSELRARTLYQVMAWWGRSTERQLP